MPARARPTVPHGGPRPHREHRADGGRVEDYHWKREQRRRLKAKERARQERETKKAIKSLKAKGLM